MTFQTLFAIIFLTCLSMTASVDFLSSNSNTLAIQTKQLDYSLLRFQSGIAKINSKDAWNNGHLGFMANGSGGRKSTTHVKFAKKYSETPIVTLGVIELDVFHAANQRYNILIKNITKEGFDVEFSTWADSKIYSSNVSWQAVGKS